MKSRPARVLCVDDHSFIVEGLKVRLDLEDDMEFVGSLSSADGLADEAERLAPDVVLLDIEMPGRDPFEAIADLHRRCPGARTIMLSAYVRDHYISAATRAGAWGYFCKSEDASTLVEGIRSVVRGHFAAGPTVQARYQPNRDLAHSALLGLSRLDLLTRREQEILRMIGRGLSRSGIAKVTGRSPKTIDGHRESIMQKLDIHDRGELVRFAIREGLAEA